jgi:hypothetical protein
LRDPGLSGFGLLQLWLKRRWKILIEGTIVQLRDSRRRSGRKLKAVGLRGGSVTLRFHKRCELRAKDECARRRDDNDCEEGDNRWRYPSTARRLRLGVGDVGWRCLSLMERISAALAKDGVCFVRGATVRTILRISCHLWLLSSFQDLTCDATDEHRHELT